MVTLRAAIAHVRPGYVRPVAGSTRTPPECAVGLRGASVGFMRYDKGMTEALALAGQAGRAGEVPVGAVVLDASGVCIGRGRNRRETDDPLAHAEIEAIRQASRVVRVRSVGNGGAVAGGAATGRASLWNLAGCTLIVTLEPCPMCAGAVVQTHMDRVVFGAWDEKLGACGSVWDIPRDPHIGHHPEVVGGLRADECSVLLSEFFRGRRSDRGPRL